VFLMAKGWHRDIGCLESESPSFFLSPSLSLSLFIYTFIYIRDLSSSERDNAVYWKTNGKINNDLQYMRFQISPCFPKWFFHTRQPDSHNPLSFHNEDVGHESRGLGISRGSGLRTPILFRFFFFPPLLCVVSWNCFPPRLFFTPYKVRGPTYWRLKPKAQVWVQGWPAIFSA